MIRSLAIAAAFVAGVLVGLYIAGTHAHARALRGRPGAWTSMPCATETLGMDFIVYTCRIERN